MTDWGSVADWVAGIGTSAATSIAAYSIWRDKRRAYKAEAQLVSVVRRETDNPSYMSQWGFSELRDEVVISIRNSSSLPMIAVYLLLDQIYDTESVAEIAMQVCKEFAAGSSVDLRVQELPTRSADESAPTWIAQRAHAIAFVDADGRRWLRTIEYNKLIQVSEPSFMRPYRCGWRLIVARAYARRLQRPNVGPAEARALKASLLHLVGDSEVPATLYNVRETQSLLWGLRHRDNLLVAYYGMK